MKINLPPGRFTTPEGEPLVGPFEVLDKTIAPGQIDYLVTVTHTGVRGFFEAITGHTDQFLVYCGELPRLVVTS